MATSRSSWSEPGLPAHRRQGHFASAMRAALAFCDERYPSALLCTAQPELYPPFGFRLVDEHKVVAGAAPRLDACPDALGLLGTPEPHVLVDGDDAIGGAGAVQLMARGSFPGGPLMLPRPFRC
ncbi:hypothetical protein [Sorangium sp. So ce1000]|uniref:hypothetical protein n=1 Tax=Sorangium sp. So ce1000 TaxID=3133325 RepID=UPI003F5D7791